MALFCSSVIPAVTFILWILSFFLMFYAAYYFIISLFAFKSYKTLTSFPPQNKFAVIIAARNEAQVIGNLINSLKKQDYPSDQGYLVYLDFSYELDPDKFSLSL
ncbi:MAG TPA: hypothetical protein VM577_07780 [Anaerovoracaceae bacterium]|nr:hypothetical protein [Anaerovoracaceae bacterium]